MNKDIVQFIKDKGLLLEKTVYDVLEGCDDFDFAKLLLENLERVSGQKMITSATLTKNYDSMKPLLNELPGESKKSVQNIFIKLGINLEIHKTEQPPAETEQQSEKETTPGYNIFYATHDNEKKIEVKDFVGHFRSRYQQIQRILMQRQGLENLTSINKLPVGSRQSFTFIGIVTEKRITKNKNLIITFEDLTGKVNALVKADSDSFLQAQELQLDDVVAVKGAGSRELVFVYDIIYPDAMKVDKVKFNEDLCVAFVSDVHCGSNKHLGTEFERFVYWLNSDNELANKIKYIFFVGDNVDGVGVFPGQERLLDLTSLEEQYGLLASYLRRIPKDITMFMCPGQHDSVRVPEPQPVIDPHYGKELHEIDNLVLVSNPTTVKLIENDKEFSVLMYHGASIHHFINEISELRLMKAHSCPAKAVRHMLKRRHLAPSHGVSPTIVYVPNTEKDPLVIEEVPDVLCTGEVHRLDIERYNGVLIITGSCWQAQTDFEEKVGNVPDPCKVPILNLKTHELKILDFSMSESDKKGEA